MYNRELAIKTLISDDLDTSWNGVFDYLHSILFHGFKGYAHCTDEELIQELTERDISHLFGDNDE